MPDIENFTGKTALVTGSGQGMGRAIAVALAQRGASVVINDVNGEQAGATARDLAEVYGIETMAVAASVIDRAAVHEMVAAIVERFGGLHILVNNAGVLRPTKAIDIPEEEWDWVVDVNLKGTFLVSQAVLPVMREQAWGRIVNISSSAGRSVSTVGGAHYTAAKAGVLGFSRHLAKEEAGHGITVNAICPGLFDTEMVRHTIDDARTEAYAKSFPIQRLGLPEEVAELVAFLASDRAAYITGASLDINGGDLMI
ncbi:MAG: SDR family oxidoreductase [Thermomicrobiales bacterium]|nr:SDR family oxidoreductase [Thermomicrobiales bacterium]